MRNCVAVLALPCSLALAQGATLDLNGGFERHEAVNQAFADAAARDGIAVSPRVAQVWQINTGALAARGQPCSVRLVDDPGKAHSGQCALELKPGEVFVPSFPVRGGARVTVRFWATGRAAATFGAWLTEGKSQNLYPPPQPVGDGKPDAKGYVEYVEECRAPENASALSLSLGAEDGLVDDVTLEVEGTLIAAPDLARQVEADGDTLALATGDAPLPAGALFTGALVDGPFGRGYELKAENLLQLPGKYGELLGGGTIELWLRPHWSGRDEQDHSLVGLESDGFGYWLIRTQYNHIAFAASDGYGSSLGEVQAQHWQFANRWGAGDWHHVAVSWTPTWYTLFVDGYPVDTARDTSPKAVNQSWCAGKLPSKVPALAALGSPGTDVAGVRISRSARYWIVAGEAPPPGPAPVAAAAQEPAIPPPSTAGGPPIRRPAEEEPKVPPREEPIELCVDGSAEGASDDNPGTTDQPFRTIGRGVKELRPGDTLTVRGGTYREAVDLQLVGTQEHPITVQAAPGETVVIKGSEVVTGWVRDGNVWRREGWTADYVAANFAQGTQLVSPNLMEVYQQDGVRGEAVVLYRVRKPEELREGKCYWDEATGTITIWPVETEGPFDPNTRGVEVPVRGPGLSVGKQWVRVRGFQVRQCGMAMITNWPSVSVNGFDCSLEDSVVTWCDFGGVSMSGFRTAIRRCEASYCGNSGMGAGVGEEMLIEDCIVTHNNFWRYSPGWHGGGAKLIPWFNRSVVRRSEFAFNYGPGLWFDGSCNDSLVEDCRCHDNEGPGIMIEISRGIILRNNLCYSNRNGLPGIDLIPLEGKGYSPVACEARRVEGGAGGAGIFISSSPDTKCYHNLCYRNESMGIFAEWARRISSDAADFVERTGRDVTMSTHGVDVRNNILVNNGGCQLSLRRNGVDEDTYGNRSDYNLLFDGTGGTLVRWGFGGAAFSRLDKWQEASGFDQHSVVAAPLFGFSPGMDLRLQPDSAGVDQGEPVPEVPTDLLGVQRPQGAAVDLGPYEIAGTRRVLERPQVPTNLTYFSVDLSQLVNRAFADEQADDGQGGWSDQGPSTDLRVFPGAEVGQPTEQTFDGVPFRVLSPLGCVVLRSGYRPQSQDLPERVVIPVNHKADVLYFLHSGAWLGNGQHEWTYTIHRGDGTQEEVRVVGGESIRDWSDPNPGLPFDREYPTTTTVAWTGTNPTFDRVSVYAMAWVNHSDWCDVTDVEMTAAPGGGVPILIAITGGVTKEGG